MRLTSLLICILCVACAAEGECPPLGGDFSVFGSTPSSEFCDGFVTEGSLVEPGSIHTLCDGCLQTLHRNDEGRWIAWGRGREPGGDPPVEVCHVYSLGCLEDDTALGELSIYPNPDGADCEVFLETDVEAPCNHSVVFYPPP